MKPINAILFTLAIFAIMGCSLVSGSTLTNAHKSEKDEMLTNADLIDIPAYQQQEADSDEQSHEEGLIWADFKPHMNKREQIAAALPGFYNYLRLVERDAQKAKKGFNPQTRWGKRSSNARFNPQTRWG